MEGDELREACREFLARHVATWAAPEGAAELAVGAIVDAVEALRTVVEASGACPGMDGNCDLPAGHGGGCR